MSDPSMSPMDHGHDVSGHPNNKRKRDHMDSGDVQRLAHSVHGGQNNQGGPTSPFNMQPPDSYYDSHNATDLSHIDQQLLQAVGNQNGVSDESAMTAKAALAAHQPESKYPPPDPSYDGNGLGNNLNFGQDVGDVSLGVQGHNSTAAAVYAAREAQAQAQVHSQLQQQMAPKPNVGSAEWHQIRKNNHKEVERRRRETINEGINEIAKLVPGCEKAKGSILQRAIQYINKLQEDAKEMSARFETTNMTTNQAITEIGTQNIKLKAEVNRRGNLSAKWIQRCREAGLVFDDYDDEKTLMQLDIDDTNQHI
ncbi:basic helix-loop-helix protein [Myotisia sp. PD_48]|nr:basic helix-loop-helix protein [Myotisia sp. PD_48]